jgi:hypothetical protein
MDDGQDHYDSCHLGDLCQSLELITQSSKKIFAQFVTSRSKVFLTEIFDHIEPDIIQRTGCRI